MTRTDLRGDTGSITVLVLGMTLCLLLLVGAITALGSVFLARQRLQNLCDGAVLVAADTVGPSGYTPDTRAAVRAVNEYVRIRWAGVSAVVSIDARTATVECAQTVPVVLAWSVDITEADISVVASSNLKRSVRNPG